MEAPKQPQEYPVLRPGSFGPGWAVGGPQGSECEYLRSYTDDGLCPVLIDDVLSGPDLTRDGKPCSFRVIGKLGWGSYSTVWLGRENNSGEYLALKMLRREYSTMNNSEMSILRKLGKLETAFFHTHAPTQDRFLCLGLKPLGCTLRDRYEHGIVAPRSLSSLTVLVKTLLMKVLGFHQRQICHGDISANNVSFGVHPEAFTDEALHETFELDRKAKIHFRAGSDINTPPPRPANLPEYIILSQGIPLKTNLEDMSRADIIDFGKGFETSSKSNVFGTENYSAPEVNRDGTNLATAKSDLWSLGCVFAYARTCEHLFDDGDDLDDYLAADYAGQSSFIESSIRIRDNDRQYLLLFARLIHSLVRVNPEERDPEEAMRIIKQLESLKTS